MLVAHAMNNGFQSTLPARGATQRATGVTMQPEISIHAPRTGSDAADAVSSTSTKLFQSTLPARGATPVAAHQRVALLISIHAPRTGSDSILRLGVLRRVISIHAPRTGSDLYSTDFWKCQGVFQSTLPARGATFITGTCKNQREISIHAPRTGSDGGCQTHSSQQKISIHAPRTGSDRSRG